MKFNLLSLGLFSVATLLPLMPSFTPSASACVMVDVATQLAIRGSQTPSEQINDVDVHNGDLCYGNATVNAGSQVYTGEGPVRQVRESDHYLGGDAAAYPESVPYTGVADPMIGVPIEFQMDMYSPAYDPAFMNNYQGMLPAEGSYYPGMN